MKIRAYGLTDVGLARDHNEDSYLVDEANRLFIVADGMGGHAAGEVASRIAVDTVAQFMDAMREEATWPYETNRNLSTSGNKLTQAVRMANRKVLDATHANESYRGMGTTLVSMTFYSGDDGSVRVCIGHVGDSRAYRVRDGQISQVTSDHSWINVQVQSGIITAEAARKHPLRNVITRALGSEEDVEVDIIESDVKEGDRYILCTDGLNTMLQDAAILESVAKNAADPKVICEVLVQRANAAGGEDNVTAILVAADPE